MSVHLSKANTIFPTNILVGFSIVSLFLLLTSCVGSTPSKAMTSPQPSPTVAPSPSPSSTAVDSLHEKSYGLVSSYTGDVRAKDQVTILAKMPGRIKEIKVDVGDPVKKDDLIVVLEHEALDAQVKQAEAALAAAEASLAKLEAGPRPEQVAAAEAALRGAQAQLALLQAGPTEEQIEIAETQVRLAKNQLFAVQTQADAMIPDMRAVYTEDMKEANTGVGWEQVRLAEAQLEALKAPPQPERVAQLQSAIDTAKQQLELAKSPFTKHDLEAAKAQVAQAKATSQLAEAQREEAFLHSPIDGWIASKSLSIGALVSPATPILTIITSEVEVVVAVEETAISHVKAGQPVTIKVPAYTDRAFNGTIISIAPLANPVTRTFDMLVSPSDTDGLLRSGMFATVSLLGDSQRSS